MGKKFNVGAFLTPKLKEIFPLISNTGILSFSKYLLVVCSGCPHILLMPCSVIICNKKQVCKVGSVKNISNLHGFPAPRAHVDRLRADVVEGASRGVLEDAGGVCTDHRRNTKVYQLQAAVRQQKIGGLQVRVDDACI